MFPSSTQSHSAESLAPASPHGSSCSCRLPSEPNKISRNLIVGIDGTANKFGRKNTNVVKLLEAIDCDAVGVKQDKYYLGGIGTRPKVAHVVKRMNRSLSDKLDMVIAWNVSDIVKDAYGWLAGEYQEGDRIYLFGFSRGAYQVRILAWMIHEVGLIKHSTERQIGSAYDHFESIMLHKPGASYMAREFRKMFSREDSRVHFIGVWDTVSSVGFERGDVCLSTSSAAEHACHIRHALALDECRVRFLPEYFLEMNCLSSRGDTKGVSETEWGHPDQYERRSSDIKEVWFAGSHSDVGGRHHPGKPSHAGKFSLMWMRREATTSGLVLKPEDIFCTAEDLDLGTTSSMSLFWKLIEVLPLQHQVSFSGSGENARKWHLGKPRRIIPGQKIHASVKLTRSYLPKATFGKDFGDPFSVNVPMSPFKDIWEWDTIDQTTYDALFNNLSEAGTADFYLHRLLFILRFNCGQSSISSAQRRILKEIICNQSGLVKLAAIAATAEATNSSDSEAPLLEDKDAKEIRDLFQQSLRSKRECRRAASLLPPIAKHTHLRNLILTDETDGVIDRCFELLDSNRKGPCLASVLHALCSLVEHCPEKILEKLGEKRDGKTNRVLLMLDSNDPSQLIAALLVVTSLVPKEPLLCLQAKTRLHELAKKYQGRVGPLATRALAMLHLQESRAGRHLGHDPYWTQRQQLRENANNSNDQGWTPTEGGYVIHRMLPTEPLGSADEMLSKTLLNTIDGRNISARTTVILSLLQKREAGIELTTYSLSKDIMDVFVKQLQFKKSALLAAYALMRCFTDEEFSVLVDSRPRISEYIVRMIKLDYFDEAIGPTEGMTILEDLMKHDELKRKVLGCGIASLLQHKLGTGTPRGMRTGLIYLKILRGHHESKCTLTDNLVGRGMSLLKNDKWKTQKKGVAILCSLAQVGFGVEALKGKICEIIDLLLPKDHSDTQQDEDVSASRPSKSPASLLGPAFVIHVLAGNETLREHIRGTEQYGKLKRGYLFGDLLSGKKAHFWQVKTPTRDDVLEAINQMIKTVDATKGSTDTGFVLPYISHWDQVGRLVVKTIVIPPGVAAAAAVMIAGVVIMMPVFAARLAYKKLGRSVGHLWPRPHLDEIPNIPSL